MIRRRPVRFGSVGLKGGSKVEGLGCNPEGSSKVSLLSLIYFNFSQELVCSPSYTYFSQAHIGLVPHMPSPPPVDRRHARPSIPSFQIP